MPNPLTPIEDTTGLGPAMLALNEKQRRFVFAFFEFSGHGQLAKAARAAGYGNPDSPAETYAKAGWRLSQVDAVIEAIKEVAKKRVRSLAAPAVQAVEEIVLDVHHKDRLKAANRILDTFDAVEQRSHVDVSVSVKADHDAEAVAALRAFRKQGASREFLENWFGFSGLSRYEKLLAIEDGNARNIVEGDYQVVGSSNGIVDLVQ
jgi:phage terminase small subunit